MSSTLEMLLEKVEDLSGQELLSLQERITSQLKIKVSPNGNGQVKKQASLSSDYVEIPGAYRLTPEQVKEIQQKIFTPEELANMGTTDFSNLPQGPKSLSQIVIEDREDRV